LTPFHFHAYRFGSLAFPEKTYSYQ
jgi:hypothetical protein